MNVLNTTSLTASVNVTGLSRAVEYNITVTGVSDGNEVTGNKANLLMTLDGIMHRHHLIFVPTTF